MLDWRIHAWLSWLGDNDPTLAWQLRASGKRNMRRQETFPRNPDIDNVSLRR